MLESLVLAEGRWRFTAEERDDLKAEGTRSLSEENKVVHEI